MSEPTAAPTSRRVAVCTHCGIVIVPELHAWIGSLSGSLNCGLSPSKRHEPTPEPQP